MFDEILNWANRYDEGLAHVHSRQDQWLAGHERVRDHLKAIADHLNQNARYRQGFFVDTLHAFNEGMRGTNTRMPSLEFRSGPMPMPITFRNSIGEKMTYEEEGFSISFTPTITGEILVLLQPHTSDLEQDPPELVTLGVIREPGQLTNPVIEQLIARGMEIAFYGSFTGMGEQPHLIDQDDMALKRNPIGFKRHDTTEKI
ncbi:hypothetical protein GCM10023093_28820 [Nemorincola caseinilytica]|uniref:Uncharacterized protein n=1 Tax=Nemorincola caseinilytica TaxID=2054315 RepID=A0ABP8NLY7_9BACT